MWNNQNRVRPGVSVNVRGVSPLAVEYGARGVVVLPLELDFGPSKEFTTITCENDLYKMFGYSFDEAASLAVREALKGASKVLLYRVNGGDMASVNLTDEVIATALYSGERGNELSVKVTTSGEKFVVATYLSTALVDTQTVTTAEELEANQYVKFSGTGELVAVTVTLSGGSSSTAVTQDYKDMLTAAKLEDFQAIAYVGSDVAFKTTLAEYAKSERDTEDKRIVVVMGNSTNSYDNEGVIVVLNGVKLSDGTEISNELAAAWVAGVTAGANVTESNTFKKYDGAVDVTQKYTNSEIETHLSNGLFMFTVHGTKVVAEYDINTLTSYTVEKPKDFRKNKVIRVVDSIVTDVKSIFEESFIGKVQNNDSGRNVLKGFLVDYLTGLYDMGAIENFAPEDVVVEAGTDKDAVVITLTVLPTDCIEKIYVNVEVK